MNIGRNIDGVEDRAHLYSSKSSSAKYRSPDASPETISPSIDLDQIVSPAANSLCSYDNNAPNASTVEAIRLERYIFIADAQLL
jgi:hypothetical protein